MKTGGKPRVVISACLLGSDVRYDGGNKRDVALCESLGQLVEWVPLCPEAEAGLSTPREPMQLVVDGMRTRLITCETKHDLTDVLDRWIVQKMRHLKQERINGFVLKARSPSCGVSDVELYSNSGDLAGFGAGLFARAVTEFFPSLPVEDEEGLRDLFIREKYLNRLGGRIE